MFVTSLILFIKELMDKFFKSLNELPTFKNELITSFNLLIITLMSFSISTNSLSSAANCSTCAFASLTAFSSWAFASFASFSVSALT